MGRVIHFLTLHCPEYLRTGEGTLGRGHVELHPRANLNGSRLERERKCGSHQLVVMERGTLILHILGLASAQSIVAHSAQRKSYENARYNEALVGMPLRYMGFP